MGSERGIYPAVDPLDSTSRIMDPNIIGAEHYEVARGVQKILQDYKSLQDIIAILGMDELSEEDKLKVARARKIERWHGWRMKCYIVQQSIRRVTESIKAPTAASPPSG